MNVILSMAISANGIIASETGSEDFLSHRNWLQFTKLAKQVGCIIWGRKTYDAVIKWEGNYLNTLQSIKKIIISKSDITLQKGFELAHSPEEAILKLEREGCKDVIVTGGATINSEFAKRNLIDEVIFDVNPSVLGAGIPIFHSADFTLQLKLIDVKKIEDGIVELHYNVKK